MINADKTNKLPPNWVECKLKDIGEVVSGGTPATNEITNWGNDVAWITPADLSNHKGMFISRGKKSLSQKGFYASSTQLLPKGSILFSSRAPIGYVAIASEAITTNQGFKNIILYPGIYSKYVYYYLLASKEKIEQEASGTTFKEISLSKFKEIPFPLCSSTEQIRISQQIDQILSEIEKSEQLLEIALTQIVKYKERLLKEAYDGRLTAEWRSQQKRLKTGQEIINDLEQYWLNFNIKESGNRGILFENLKEDFKTQESIESNNPLPDGWINVTLGSISKKISNINSKKQKPTESFRYIDIGSINNKKNKILSYKEIFWRDAPSRAQQLVETGDILFSTVRTYLRNIAQVESLSANIYVASSGFAVIRPIEIIDSDYLFKFVLSDSFVKLLDKKKTGSSYPSVRDNDIFSQKVPICSIDEQKVLSLILEEKFSLVDNAEELTVKTLKEFQILKAGYLKKAFAGRLMDQNEKDEDASLLLQKLLSLKTSFKNYLTETKMSKRQDYMNTITTEEQKDILDILPINGDQVLSKDVWLLSTYKDDIDSFYNRLKQLIESGLIEEAPRLGKDSFLKLVFKNEN